MLNITEVRIKKINKGDLLAAASICIDDCFIIREIKLLNGKMVDILVCQREKWKIEILGKTFHIH